MENTFPQQLPPPKKSNVLKIVIIVVALILISGGVLFATGIWNPFRPNPNDVLKNAFTKMAEWKTNQAETLFSLNANDTKTGQQINISLGSISSSDTVNAKSSALVKLAGTFSQPNTTFSFTIDINTISVGSDGYFRLEKLELPQAFQAFLPMLLGTNPNTLVNQWIKVDKDSIQEVSKVFGGTIQNMNQNQLDELMNQNQASEKQRQLIERMQRVIAESEISNITKQFPDQDGMYHYLVTINKEGVKKIINEFYIALSGATGNYQLPQPTNEAIDQLFTKIGDINYEVWIGKGNGELYRLKIDKNLDLANIGTSTGTIAIVIDAKYSGMNEPVEITAPANFKTLKQAFPVFNK